MLLGIYYCLFTNYFLYYTIAVAKSPTWYFYAKSGQNQMALK